VPPRWSGGKVGGGSVTLIFPREKQKLRDAAAKQARFAAYSIEVFY
jgi:hypothetical protein